MTSTDRFPLPPADTSDPRWVGMWWGGFLICGIGMFVLGAPFFLFPKSLEVRGAEHENSEWMFRAMS